MSEQTQQQIGKLLKGNEGRDAIHFAVAPVVAAERLTPGQHVGFVQSSQDAVGSKGVHIGIIDPFLTAPVRQGERVWLFLYPNTITALRHNWTHPAFISAPSATAGASEQWLREFARNQAYMSYEELLGALERGYICFNGIPNATYDEQEQAEIFAHAEAVLGRQFSTEHKKNAEFTCSC